MTAPIELTVTKVPVCASVIMALLGYLDAVTSPG